MNDSTPSKLRIIFAWLPALLMCVLHTIAVVQSMGGIQGIISPWPISQHDHPIFVHATWTAPDLLARSGTDAGYDPYFMAGAPKSVVFPQAAAYFEIFGVLARWVGLDPARAHKLAVLTGTSLPPWLILVAARNWRLSPGGCAATVILFLLYMWTDGGGAGFPLNYAYFGMVPYLLAVPLSLVGLSSLTRWLEFGGAWGWTRMTLVLSLTWLVHLTTPMLLLPAGLAAYAACVVRSSGRQFPRRWHLSFWMIPLVVAILNIWWWLPGVALASTKAETGFAFNHPEPVISRLLEIFKSAPVIQPILIACLGPGLWLLAKKSYASACGLGAFVLAGFGWGYLAGNFRDLDFLQPGRHTYALFAGAVFAGGLLWEYLSHSLKKIPSILSAGIVTGFILLSITVFAGPASDTVKNRLGSRGVRPFLSSEPNARFRWILDQVRTQMRPGQRLLYEESGTDLPGIPDPYQGQRYSGLLPWMTGVELIGGPYLRSAVTTNHVQFGEGKLLEKEAWGLEDFEIAAQTYGPTAILCWSPRAVRLCREHPELFEIISEHKEYYRTINPQTGRIFQISSGLIFAKIRGVDGAILRGKATVTSRTGVIEVKDAQADELDGLVVLRYHLLPMMRSIPHVPVHPVYSGNDPVPLIGFEPRGGPVVFELNPLRPWAANNP